MVGFWRVKVYEMNNVVVSIKFRKVFGLSGDKENGGGDDEFCDVLMDEEQKQLEVVFKLDLLEFLNVDSENGFVDVFCVDFSLFYKKQEKKGWLGGWRKKEVIMIKQEKEIKYVFLRSFFCVNEKVSNFLGDINQIKLGRYSVDNDYIRKLRVFSKSY